ncbi:MAG: alpha/beta fold hydrolase [Lautropia sp.]
MPPVRPDIPPPSFFTARDGTRLAWREVGSGRPIVLIHGFFSTAVVNWIKYGHAATLAARGFRVIMPDLRGHGDSAKPHDPAAYPPDVLAGDGLALLDALGLAGADYDLGGYSLGGRTVIRMMVRGAAPRRAIVAGMGLDAIVDTAGRGAFFRRVLTNPGSFAVGTPEWRSEAFLKTVGGDPVALLQVLESSVDTSPAELAAIQVPTRVLVGAGDEEHASAEPLARELGNATFETLPGNHMSAVANAALGRAIAAFVAD